jgi:endoglucanase
VITPPWVYHGLNFLSTLPGELHYIIAGGVNFNSVDELFNLPVYPHEKLIYTFHFYEPYLFACQGETWGAPPGIGKIKGIPFPSDVRAVPDFREVYKGTWVENFLGTYPKDTTVESMAGILDKAARFFQERGVPVYCGEYGVFMPNALHEDRVRWYQAATTLLDNRNITRPCNGCA